VGLAAVIDHPEGRAVGDDALAAAIAAIQAEAAGGALGAGAQAGGAGVLVDFVQLVVEQPNVRAVRGDAFDLSVGIEATGRPGADYGAVGVVDVDGLVCVHDPNRRAGGIGGHATRGGIAAAEVV